MNCVLMGLVLPPLPLQMEREWEAKRKELAVESAKRKLLAASGGGPVADGAAAATLHPASVAVEEEVQSAGKRPRRGAPVDYGALNKKLEAEAAAGAAAAGGGS